MGKHNNGASTLPPPITVRPERLNQSDVQSTIIASFELEIPTASYPKIHAFFWLFWLLRCVWASV